MAKQFRPALVLIVLFTILTGLIYPLAVTGLAQAVFPDQASGSLVFRNGVVVGSRLIGQSFKSDGYFHGRPSATTDTDPDDPTKTITAPYNAAASSGSNLGPTSKALVERVQSDIKRLGTKPGTLIPADLVTTSASGLDPHISPAAAELQVARVARTRNLPVERVRALVAASTSGRLLGIIGEPSVNVLKLNLALDAIKS